MGEKRKRVRMLLGLALLGVVPPAAFFGYRTVRWHGMIARADRLQSGLDLEDSSRPVLWGESRPGNAWPDYTHAIGALSEDAGRTWSDYLRACKLSSQKQAVAIRDKWLAENREALVALQDGTHRERSRCPIDWQQGFARKAPNILASRTLANLGVLEGERYLDLGQPGPALEQFLDVMQFGRDHMQTPMIIDEMIGAALLQIGLEALIDGGNLDRLGPTQLERLGLGLHRLDDGISILGRGLPGELVLFASTVAHAGLPEPWAEMATWQWGYSMELLSADHAERFAALLGTYRGLAATPWLKARPALVSSSLAMRSAENPITRDVAMDLISYVSTRRQAIARLRMVRMAVDHRSGREIESLGDPFGDLLSSEIEGDKLVIWSKGSGGRQSPSDRIELATEPAAPSGR